MNHKLGVNNGFFKEPSLEKWQSLRDAGFTEIELGISGQLPLEQALLRAEEQYTKLTEAGLNISSVHLPFGKIHDPSSPDMEARYQSYADYVGMLDWMKKHAIGIAILHASYEPIAEEEREQRRINARDYIERLGQEARQRNITLAIENLPRTCIGNTADDLLFVTQNGTMAKMCFDVNHLLIESHKDFYTQVAEHVVTTHISDYDRSDEKHWLPGDGCIDWQELAALFETHNYEGRLIFEFGENASPKLERPFTPVEMKERLNEIGLIRS